MYPYYSDIFPAIISPYLPISAATGLTSSFISSGYCWLCWTGCTVDLA